MHGTGAARTWGARAAGFAAVLSAAVFLGQIFGKWEEGGWIRLVSFSTLFLLAHLILLSPAGYRAPKQVYRIVREKARVQGAMASIVEWQAFRMQEYRYRLMTTIASLLELFGVGQEARRVPAYAWASAGTLAARLPSKHAVAPLRAATLRPAPKPAATAPEGDTVDIPLDHLRLPPRLLRNRIILPINAVHQGTLTALRYARTLSSDVTAVHVSIDAAETVTLRELWRQWGEGVRLVVLEADHGLVLEPLLRYIVGLMDLRQPNETITIIVPQSIRPRWWSNLMRTQMSTLLRLALPLETGVVITDVPYQLDGEHA